MVAATALATGRVTAAPPAQRARRLVVTRYQRGASRPGAATDCRERESGTTLLAVPLSTQLAMPLAKPLAVQMQMQAQAQAQLVAPLRQPPRHLPRTFVVATLAVAQGGAA